MSFPVNYETIRYSSPYNIGPYNTGAGSGRPENKGREIKLWQALLFFVCLMIACELLVTLLYIFVLHSQAAATIIQELLFLAASVLYVKIKRVSLKKVFPLKKPRAGAVFGVCIFAAASYLAADVISVWTFFLAPRQITAVSEGMDGIFVSPLLEFITVVILPPVCEEALHRGVILEGCRNSLKKWPLIIAADGIIFGLFHIYPVRWAAPAFIGCIMAWTVLETDNMLYSSMLHALYNFLILLSSLAASSGSGSADTAAVSVNMFTVGAMTVFYGVFIPILIYTGAWLVRCSYEPVRPAFIENGMKKKRLLQIFLPTFIILVAGIIMMAAGSAG